MLSRFFIDRPVAASVVSILIVLLGAVAYFALPVAEYPELAPPVVHVEAVYPGANAQTMADTVATTLEQEINGVDNMIYMNSTSSDGRYSLDISFEQGVDVDMAAVLVNNRVAIASPKLPEEVRRQGVTVKKQSTSFVGVISVSAKKGFEDKYDDLFLSNYLSLNLKDEMSRVKGVGGIDIRPGKDYGMRIWLDPLKLRARSLTVGDVNSAIRAQNVQVAAGAVGRQPAPKGQDFELVINTLGRLSTPEQFGDIIIKEDAQSKSIVRIRDVARVELGAKDYGSLAQFNGQPAAIMIIYQLPGANLVEVANQVNAKLAEFQKTLPEGVEGKMFYDASMFITASLDAVFHTLIEAFILVFIVVFIFLQSVRSTMIPIITIPVALIGAFLFMAMLGFSINTLTMFGLVLAIGIVVDDAIVVVENVERNLAISNLSPRKATIKSMTEIFGPVIAITLVLMSVFVPAASLPGITGQMYRQFALTIAASTLLSAICALTLSPALCALLLKRHDESGHHKKKSVITAPFRWVGDAFNKVFGVITTGYAAVVRLLLRAWPISLAGFAGVLVLTAFVYRQVPGGFVPNEDLGFVVVSIQLPDSASTERAAEVVKRAGDIIGDMDAVADRVMLTGFSVIEGQGSNLATVFVPLKPWGVRVPNGQSIDKIMADLQRKLGAIPEANFQVFSFPAIRGLGNTSGIDLRIQDRKSQGSRALVAVSNAVSEAAMGQQGRFRAVFSTFRPGVPQLFLDIDREKALKLGVPLGSIFETLQTQLGGAYVNDYNQFNRTWQVNVQAESQFRLQAEDVLKLEVRNNTGGMVPLGALLSVKDDFGPARISRYNLFPTASIIGIPTPGVTSTNEAIQIMDKIMKDPSVFPQDGSFGAEWSSMSYQEKQATEKANPALTFGLALLVVYLILAFQYESVTTPLAVVLSVPLVVIGAMLALSIRGLDNNVFAQIGLVLLVGLGAKNAILIVEFAKENRARGEGILESAVDAARTRFRPILMTSFAFILGVVPLVTATGAGASSRRALGTAVFGGMIGVTVLGLLFTPLLYVIITSISERASSWFGREAVIRKVETIPDAEAV